MGMMHAFFGAGCPGPMAHNVGPMSDGLVLCPKALSYVHGPVLCPMAYVPWPCPMSHVMVYGPWPCCEKSPLKSLNQIEKALWTVPRAFERVTSM